MGDLADRLQVSVTALNDLAFAAKASDVSLEDLTLMLETLARKAADKGIISPDLLGDFAALQDQISKLGTVAEQADFAKDFFGKGVVSGLTLLRKTRAEMAALFAEHKQLGAPGEGVFLRIDLADQALKRISAMWNNFKMAAAAAIAPVIIWIVEMAKELLSFEFDVENVGDKILEAFGRGALKVAEFVDWLRDTRHWLAATWDVLVEWAPTIGKIALAFLAIAAAIKVVKFAMVAYAVAQKAVAMGQAALLALSGPKGWAILAVSAGIATVAALGIDAAFNKIQDEYKNAMAKIDAESAKLKPEKSLAEDVRDALPSVEERVRLAMQRTQEKLNAVPPERKPLGVSRPATLELSQALSKGTREADNAIKLWKFGQNPNTLLAKVGELKDAVVIQGSTLVAIRKAIEEGLAGVLER